MARLFNSTTDRLSNGTLTLAATGSVFCRLKPNWAHNDSATHMILYFGGASAPVMSFQKFANNNAYCGAIMVADDRIVVAATADMFSSGVWANHLYTYDDTANSQVWYVNNVSQGSTAALQFQQPTGITVGNAVSGLEDDNLDGTMAEFAIWNVVLTAAERIELDNTKNPRNIRRGLVHHWRLRDAATDEPALVGGETLTNANTTAAAHPQSIDLAVEHHKRHRLLSR